MKKLFLILMLMPSPSWAQTYYFQANGFDDDICGIVEHPCVNLQRVYQRIQQQGTPITHVVFKLADGLYDGASLQANGPLPGQPSPQQLEIIGNTAHPDYVVIRPSGRAPSFTAAYGAMFYLEGVKMDHSNTQQDMIIIGQYSTIRLNNVEFGYNFNPWNHITVNTHGYLEVDGSYKISGGGQCHILLGNQATAYFNTNGQQGLISVHISGNPEFYAGFLYVASNSSGNIQAIDWQGTVRGRKFVIEGNSTLDIGGTHPCDVPGSQPGLRRTGGQLLTHPGSFVQ